MKGWKRDGFVLVFIQGAETAETIKASYSKMRNEARILGSNHISVIPVAPSHGVVHLNPKLWLAAMLPWSLCHS